jgi:diketogulonate reductase-like aldo/keto reductase
MQAAAHSTIILAMKTVSLPCGERMPAFGMGTWYMGEMRGSDRARRAAEADALRFGLDAGVRLIDTAEMYGEGGAEEVVGDAIAGRRDEAFIVSKVYPHNASRKGVLAACERSLKRLRTDRIDLYLLHWRGNVPFAETVEGFEALRAAGKIRHWGVSNLDAGDMEELWGVSKSVQANQLLYNLTRRGIEWDLLPWQRERRIPTMAYSPIEQARLLKNRALAEFSKRHGMTPAQAALAWLLDKEDVVVIPKASNAAHLEENFASLEKKLSKEQLAELDRAFPPPKGPSSLEML